MPCEPHIPYITCYFLLALVVSGLSDPCLSVINSICPSFVAKFSIFLLIM